MEPQMNLPYIFMNCSNDDTHYIIPSIALNEQKNIESSSKNYNK